MEMGKTREGSRGGVATSPLLGIPHPDSSNRGPEPFRPSVSSEFRRGQAVTDKQPHPMQSLSRSRSWINRWMRLSRSARHRVDSLRQSATVGVRSLGSDASAFWIAASGIPAFCASRMIAIRRNMLRG
jgi:hypothetical protein